MRLFDSSTVLLLLGLPFPPSPAHAQDVPMLRRGTPVLLQLDETISGPAARVGQRVAFEVSDDVAVDGRVVIPAGSAALGTVCRVSHRGLVAKVHRSTTGIQVRVDTVRLPSGQVVPLSTALGASTGVELAADRRDRKVLEGTVLRAFVRRDTLLVQQRASFSN